MNEIKQAMIFYSSLSSRLIEKTGAIFTQIHDSPPSFEFHCKSMKQIEWISQSIKNGMPAPGKIKLNYIVK